MGNQSNMPARFVTFQAATLEELVTKLNTEGFNAQRVIFFNQVIKLEDMSITWQAVVDYVIPIVLPYDEAEYLASLENDEMTVDVTLEDKNAVSDGYKKTNSA